MESRLEAAAVGAASFWTTTHLVYHRDGIGAGVPYELVHGVEQVAGGVLEAQGGPGEEVGLAWRGGGPPC